MPAALPHLRYLPGLMLLACLMPAFAAEPVQYRLDPVHTRVLFAVQHAGFSNAMGTVSGSTGTLLFDPADWTSAKLDVRVPMERVDLGDAKWNKAAMARNLLDVKDHPLATFVSTRIEPIDAHHASVFGTLALHGVSKEIKLDVKLNALKRHPMPPFRRTAGFSATATLSRKDFGIDAWKSVIGDTVELRIEAEALRGGGTGAEDKGDEPSEMDTAQPPMDENAPADPAAPPPDGDAPGTPEPVPQAAPETTP